MYNHVSHYFEFVSGHKLLVAMRVIFGNVLGALVNIWNIFAKRL